MRRRPYREMNEHQRKAYEQPLGAGPPPPPGHFVHPEIGGRVPLNVSLTADVGPEVADRFGAAGVWHCSVSAWPRSPSSYPIPVERWKARLPRIGLSMEPQCKGNVLAARTPADRPGGRGMYLWITTHMDGAEMQREAKQACSWPPG